MKCVLRLTNALRFDIILRMKNVQLSPKYQVVIPKSARKKMGIEQGGIPLRVKRVTKTEIVFEKTPQLEDFIGAFPGAWGKDPAKMVRKMRDEEWS